MGQDICSFKNHYICPGGGTCCIIRKVVLGKGCGIREKFGVREKFSVPETKESLFLYVNFADLKIMK